MLHITRGCLKALQNCSKRSAPAIYHSNAQIHHQTHKITSLIPTSPSKLSRSWNHVQTASASVQATVRKGTTRPARKNVITITPKALERIRQLYGNGEQPKYLRIGVKTRGCSGLEYSLDYVDQKGKLDETVVQDGVTVLVDSKALFSIIGSEMDFVEDKLSSQFVFTNPNVKETCGCGQSFMV